MAKININGVTIEGDFAGRNVFVQDGQVIIDGKTIDLPDEKIINIGITGDVQEVRNGAGKVMVLGNVGHIQTGSGDVSVEEGTVQGNIQTGSGDVKCGNVMGSVRTGSGDIYKR